MDVVVEYDKKKLQRLAQAFPKAAVSSLNRVGASTRTKISSEVRQDYNIKKSDLDKRILKPTKASPSILRTKISIRGPRIPLFAFGGKPRQPKQRANASAEIKAGKRKSFSHFFVAKMPSGHIGIFKRTGRFSKGKRETIAEVFSLSAAEMAGTKKIGAVVNSFWRSELVKVFTHNINYFRK